ncbi:MAG: SDR family oxidoreductase [Candidatus Hydrogenedentota bacterium]|nr:MAG: SDR family oxidoreductase [Candidatus Hydrogenedentota bacterium]
MKKRRALVTGCAGFLGSHLVVRLLQEGFSVVGVDNLITGTKRNIEQIEGDFRFLELDVTTGLWLEEDFDRIYHFASPASPADYIQYPIQTLKVGALGTHNVLGLAKACGGRVLLASTSEVYGDPEISPQTEDYWGHVNPIGPRGVYDEAKRFAEAMVMAYHRVHGVETRIARIFNTYGPRMRRNDGRVVPTFIDQILRGEPLTVHGDGKQTRSFTYVDDTIDGIFRLMEFENSERAFLPVNIGSSDEKTLLELAALVARLAGRDYEIRYCPLPVDDPKVRRPDITRAREWLGWEPRVTLEEGLRRTIAWFRGRSPF